MSNKEIQLSSELRNAVQTIKTAILQSQARAVKVGQSGTVSPAF